MMLAASLSSGWFLENAFLIPQRYLLTFGNFVRELLAHIQGDRHGPEHAGLEAHFFDDFFIVPTLEKSFERRKRSIQDQLEVAKLTRRQIP